MRIRAWIILGSVLVGWASSSIRPCYAQDLNAATPEQLKKTLELMKEDHGTPEELPDELKQKSKRPVPIKSEVISPPSL